MTCGCGKPSWVAGQCRSCYWRRYNSLRRFGGHRESVIERDAETCQGCGASGNVVHHREYNPQDPKLQITLCPACHAVIHRAKVMRRYLPPVLFELWAEIRTRTSAEIQLQLPLE
jgi:hypothetical protein